MWVFIQKKPEAGLCSQSSSTRRGAPGWMSFLCGALNKGSAWETRSQSCIISFLGPGQETRKGPEGTLIKSRKQHKELSFSPTAKITQPSKTRTLVWSLSIPSLADHMPTSARAGTMHFQAPLLSQSKLTSSFLSTQIPHLRLGWDPKPKTKPLRRTQPHQSFPSSTPKAHALPGSSSSLAEVSAPQVLLLLGGWSHFLTVFVRTHVETHRRGHYKCFLKEWKRESGQHWEKIQTHSWVTSIVSGNA